MSAGLTPSALVREGQEWPWAQQTWRGFVAGVLVTALGTPETGQALLAALGVTNRFAEGDPDDGSPFLLLPQILHTRYLLNNLF